jgi:hypothetical protein
VSRARRKNDALDAENTAMAVDQGRIPEAHVLSPARRELRKSTEHSAGSEWGVCKDANSRRLDRHEQRPARRRGLMHCVILAAQLRLTTQSTAHCRISATNFQAGRWVVVRPK